MSLKHFYPLLPGIIPLFFSCHQNPQEMLPGITGKPGELVIVMKDKYWEGHTGEVFKGIFCAEVPALPQPEPMLDAVQIKPDAFADIFKTHRNIFILNISPNEKEKLEVKIDVWARPQIVISLNVKDTIRAQQVLTAKGQKLLQYYLDKEKERNITTFSMQKNSVVVDKVQKKFGIKLSIPRGYEIAREADNFMWIRQEDKDKNLSLLIQMYDYKDKNTFSLDHLLDKRDEMTKAYVPGPSDGSYMQVFRDYPTHLEEVSLNGNYAAKLRGLWNVHGDFMGGPFVTYAMLNQTKDKVVMLDGFVFAPKLDKRNYIRQMDAIISSVKF